MIKALWDLTEQLGPALVVSLVRLSIGFAISLMLGTLVGVLLWRFTVLNRAFGPVLLGVQTLPSVCWVPLGILSFGLTEQAMMFVLVMGSTFAIAISMRDGLWTVPPIYHRAGTMLGARGLNYYRYILLPASAPVFASSLRQGFSFAWRSLMGGELILATRNHGLGYLLELGRSFADVHQVVAVMLVMIIVGMAVDRWLLAKLEQRVHRRFGLIT
ncbi:MAG: hypothetical protein KatS3mg104_1553 [Phycisphaerae bacterium]|nr:MAG: hypothetical protein KatS3mg104_1553 [Phycisphaerae bacterium]